VVPDHYSQTLDSPWTRGPQSQIPQGPRLRCRGVLFQSRLGDINAVKGFFARLTMKRLKRDVFHSLVALQAVINRFVA